MGNLDKIKKLDQEIEAPADFTSPEVLYNELIAAIRKYHPSDDISMIEKAYQIAYDAHKDQRRKSGEPYIIHRSVWRSFWRIWSWIKRLWCRYPARCRGRYGHDRGGDHGDLWRGGSTFSRRRYQADPDLVDDR